MSVSWVGSLLSYHYFVSYISVMSLTSRTVFVRNVSSLALPGDLPNLFGAAGTVEHVLCLASSCFYVVFADAGAVDKAVHMFDSYQLKSRKLVVERVAEDKKGVLEGLLQQNPDDVDPSLKNGQADGDNQQEAGDGALVKVSLQQGAVGADLEGAGAGGAGAKGTGVGEEKSITEFSAFKESVSKSLLDLPPDALTEILSALVTKVDLTAMGLTSIAVPQTSASTTAGNGAVKKKTIPTNPPLPENYVLQSPPQFQEKSTSSIPTAMLPASVPLAAPPTITTQDKTPMSVTQPTSIVPTTQQLINGFPSYSAPYSTTTGSGYPHILPPAVRLSVYSGDPNAKNEVSYRQWRLEVQGLRMEGYSDVHILGCIRRNVRGAAADLLLPMGESVTVTQVLRKFDMVFGEVQPTETIMQNFYRATQEPSETVAAWACRLEVILSRASSYVGSREEMLRNRFFNGIHDTNVAHALRHRYDTGASYESLLVAARKIEEEQKKKSEPKAKVQQMSSQDELSRKLDKLLGEVNTLKNRLAQAERNNSSTQQSHTKYGNNHQRQGFQGKQKFDESKASNDRGRGKDSWQNRPKCEVCNKRGHTAQDCWHRKSLN